MLLVVTILQSTEKDQEKERQNLLPFQDPPHFFSPSRAKQSSSGFYAVTFAACIALASSSRPRDGERKTRLGLNRQWRGTEAVLRCTASRVGGGRQREVARTAPRCNRIDPHDTDKEGHTERQREEVLRVGDETRRGPQSRSVRGVEE